MHIVKPFLFIVEGVIISIDLTRITQFIEEFTMEFMDVIGLVYQSGSKTYTAGVIVTIRLTDDIVWRVNECLSIRWGFPAVFCSFYEIT